MYLYMYVCLYVCMCWEQVLDRLGDLLKFNGNYSSAIEEYQQALRLRQSSLDAGDRYVCSWVGLSLCCI